ncbi:MAG TPA: DUF1566 domain-containing protein [bacterium]|nr:DUF1566 domain-containing protein [bacterium]
MKGLLSGILAMMAVLFVVACGEDETKETEMTNKQWSQEKSGITQYDAIVYCEDLVEEGHDDWRLPTISELRSLIKDCSKTALGGSCRASDGCLSSSCWSFDCDGCPEEEEDVTHSRLDDSSEFWSSSLVSELPDMAWEIFFQNGGVYHANRDDEINARCVRDAGT